MKKIIAAVLLLLAGCFMAVAAKDAADARHPENAVPVVYVTVGGVPVKPVLGTYSFTPLFSRESIYREGLEPPELETEVFAAHGNEEIEISFSLPPQRYAVAVLTPSGYAMVDEEPMLVSDLPGYRVYRVTAYFERAEAVYYFSVAVG